MLLLISDYAIHLATVSSWLLLVTMTTGVWSQREVYMSIARDVRGAVLSDLSPLALVDCTMACCSNPSCRFISVDISSDACVLMQYTPNNPVIAPHPINLKAGVAMQYCVN